MTTRDAVGHGLRGSRIYRFLYVAVLALGGVGLAYVLLPAAIMAYGWSPAGELGSILLLAVAFAALAAYLGFLLLAPPVRPQPREG